MNKSIKSTSTRSHWVFCLALVLSVFTFSGFTSSHKTNQRNATQTEQTVSIRQVSKHSISFNRLLSSSPLQVSDCERISSLLQSNREVETKLKSNANLLLTFQNPDFITITLHAPRAQVESISII